MMKNNKKDKNQRFFHYDFIKNRKGWMKIVEAFVTVLLIAGFLLIVVNEVNTVPDNSQLIFDLEYGMLRELQLNDDLRTSILGLVLPAEWNDITSNVKGNISKRKPNFLDCEAKICEIGDDCLASGSVPSDKEIYVQSAMISANLSDYLPRKIKLFCWNI